MKTRSLLVLLVVVVAAVWLGTLAELDPGYFLVSYDGHVLQTSLWVGIGLIFTAVFTLYYGARVARALLQIGGVVSAWQQRRRFDRAVDLYGKGVLHFLEGDYERAQRFLTHSTDDHPYPGNNLLLQALAASELGNFDAARQALDLAQDVPGMAGAAQIVRARVEARAGRWDECLGLLEGLPGNPAVDLLRRQAAAALQGHVEQVTYQEEGLLERAMALRELREADAQEAQRIWRGLGKSLHQEPEVVLAFVAAVSETDAEPVMAKAISNTWDQGLMVRYGSLGAATIGKRRSRLNGWLKKRPDDAALHLADGMLKEAGGDRDAARTAYEKSLALSPSPEANERLAGLLAFAGDYAAANSYLKAALHG